MDFQIFDNERSLRKKPVGERIRYYRIQKGKSQAELGQEIGVGANTISNYETGKSMPSLEHLNHFALIFGTTLDELAGSNVTDFGRPAYDKDSKSVPMLYRLDDPGTPSNVYANMGIPVSVLDKKDGFYVTWIANSDRMKSDQIEKGDILLVRLTARCENGAPVVATLCGMEIMGRYFEKEDTIFIFPNGSAEYTPYIIDRKNMDFKIFGVIEKVVKNIQ